MTYTPPAGPYKKCPTCGHRVQMPCLLCFLVGEEAIESDNPELETRRCIQCGKLFAPHIALIDDVPTDVHTCFRCRSTGNAKIYACNKEVKPHSGRSVEEYAKDDEASNYLCPLFPPPRRRE